MKTPIKNLGDALAYRLEELLDAEIKLRNAIPDCLKKVSSDSLRKELTSYANTCTGKIQKIERIFSYLMKEPSKSRSQVIDKMIENARALLESPITNEMYDVLIISCIQTINHYKKAGYKTTYTFASELEMETPADLLAEILEWEEETSKKLSSIAVYEANRKVFN